MKINFDESYVVAVNIDTLYCQCIYDFDTATETVYKLKKAGYEMAHTVTLKNAFLKNYKY